ncbi:PREDICTED: MRG/MORF4L-binding protein isoform X1 [Propithecus coquereli]|uniref:MRG/MORF4L-binding protein isoform X1 n=1 Tax=Propithecus coquereli TaxID=379532 RepID=UPI00063EF4F6|nr:PREDICTED: MRG/MORF4L-binding protein isoform X1 [Propithecus coquereli]
MGEAEVGGGGAAGDKGPGEAATSPAEETVVWSPEVEVCLFHAMLGHKPVGVNRHFHMICIRDKFSQNIGRQVPSKVIWDHLSTMYDMQALHESEILPFPNPERNFVLPEEIIQEVREGEAQALERSGLGIRKGWTWAKGGEVRVKVMASGRCEGPAQTPPPPIRSREPPGLERTSFKSSCWAEGEACVGSRASPGVGHHRGLSVNVSFSTGKVIIEEEMKEEMKEDVDPHSGADDVFLSSGSLGKAAEKSSKDKEKNSSDSGCKEGADKRKRSRVTDKVLTANSNPSSPSAAKRRRT